MDIVGAANGGTLTGAVLTRGRFQQAGGSESPMWAPMAVAATRLPASYEAPVVFSGVGQLSQTTFTFGGTARVLADRFWMNLALEDSSGLPIELGDALDSDRDPLTFDVPCAGASAELAQIEISGGATPARRRRPPRTHAGADPHAWPDARANADPRADDPDPRANADAGADRVGHGELPVRGADHRRAAR